MDGSEGEGRTRVSAGERARDGLTQVMRLVHEGGERPVHLNITMIKWIRTSRLSMKNSFSAGGERDRGSASTTLSSPEADDFA